MMWTYDIIWIKSQMLYKERWMFKEDKVE